MSDWKPIDTAPKDGSEVLLLYASNAWSKNNGPLIINGFWFSSPKEIDDGWETHIGSIGEPTHWMPMLEMPQ